MIKHPSDIYQNQTNNLNINGYIYGQLYYKFRYEQTPNF